MGLLLVVQNLCPLSPPLRRNSPFCFLLKGDHFAIPWVFLYATILACAPAIDELMVALVTAFRLRTKVVLTWSPSGMAPQSPRKRRGPSRAPPHHGKYFLFLKTSAFLEYVLVSPSPLEWDGHCLDARPTNQEPVRRAYQKCTERKNLLGVFNVRTYGIKIGAQLLLEQRLELLPIDLRVTNTLTDNFSPPLVLIASLPHW